MHLHQAVEVVLHSNYQICSHDDSLCQHPRQKSSLRVWRPRLLQWLADCSNDRHPSMSTDVPYLLRTGSTTAEEQTNIGMAICLRCDLSTLRCRHVYLEAKWY